MPQKIIWPEGKKCALLLCFDLDGSTIWLNKTRGKYSGYADFLKGTSVGQYGPNRGADRIMKILAKYGLHATFFVPGAVARDNPDVVERIAAAGHEVAHHGFDHEMSYGDTVEAQMDIIERSQQVLEKIIGRRAVGFRPTGGLLPETLKILCDDANTLYTTFGDGAEEPHLLNVDGKTTNVVNLPDRLLDDYIQMTFSFFPPIPTGLPRIAPYEDVLTNFIDEVDGVRRFGGAVCTAFHPQVSGTPGKSRITEKLILHCLECGDVWLPRCDEAAAWARSQLTGAASPEDLNKKEAQA